MNVRGKENMNYIAFTPLFVGIFLALMRAFTLRGGDGSVGDGVYRYDANLVYLMLVMALILFSVPLWLPYVQPGKDNGVVYLGCAFISTIGLIGCFWLYAFRIRISNDFIEYGAIIKKKIYFRDIRRVKMSERDIKGATIIYPASGFRVVFSYTLRNYPELRAEIAKRINSSTKIEYW